MPKESQLISWKRAKEIAEETISKMLNQDHVTLLLSNGDKVSITQHTSLDGRPYFIHNREGYPPIVRRHLIMDQAELERICKNDRVVSLKYTVDIEQI